MPAVVASPEFELTGVCTTRQESADEAKEKFGAPIRAHNEERGEYWTKTIRTFLNTSSTDVYFCPSDVDAPSNPESLDLDLLDERVRAVLNLVRPGEVVLLETPTGS